jgi:hypothetical protein
LQCAACHNHPFDHWTQDDYYSWAAVFAPIDYEIVENDRQDKFDKHEFRGEQIVHIKGTVGVKNPQTGRDATPRFLGVGSPRSGIDSCDIGSPAERLAVAGRWIANPHNAMFARAQANRIWFQIMGRGIVDPIDDFRATNPPSNPELLEALTNDFVAHDFNVKYLVRTIMMSRAYQLSSRPNATNADDEKNFARAVVRRLPAEQMLDAVCGVLDVPAEFNGYEPGTHATQIAGVERVRRREKRPAAGDRFLQSFGKPPRLLACECERSDATTLSQAIVLVGGDTLHDLLRSKNNRLDHLTQSGLANSEIVTELYWEAVGRPPSELERTACLEQLENNDRRTALEDIAWALVNSKEFVFRH